MPRIDFARRVADENDISARRLRDLFEENGTLALNFIGGPGSGKTDLIAQTVSRLPDELGVHIVTSDIRPNHDRMMLEPYGYEVQQICTLGACHLEAPMLERAVASWDARRIELLLIENIGDIICPATWDLGEESKVTVVAVTEGVDNPLRYPSVFSRSELMIINKIDLMPHVDFDIEEAANYAREVNPDIEVIAVSSKTGEGFPQWIDWLDRKRAEVAGRRLVGELAV